jgi:hypothetical protein
VLAVAAVGLSGQPPAAADQPVVTVWRSGGMDDTTLATVERVVAFTGGTIVRFHSGTIQLTEVRRGEDVVQSARPGYGFPLETGVVEGAPRGAVIPDEARAALLDGDAVLSTRSAALRGAIAGDTLHLLGWNGERIPIVVGAVVPDEQIGWEELMIPERTATDLGFDRPSRVQIVGAPDAERLRIVLTYLLASEPVRVVTSAPVVSGPPRRDWVLPAVLVKERFGEFAYRRTSGAAIVIDPDWVAEHIVDVSIPPLGRFRCHVDAVPALRRAFAEIRDAGLADELDVTDFRRAGGCFNARLMTGERGAAPSRHAWGIAIDLNPSSNPFGSQPVISEQFGDVFRRAGFAWGAGWRRPDGMHFEWQREIVPLACAPAVVPWSAELESVYAPKGPCSVT